MHNVSNQAQPEDTPKSEVATFLTLAEAAVYLGVSTETVRQWIKNGHVPAKRVGLRGTYRVEQSDLDGMVRAA